MPKQRSAILRWPMPRRDSRCRGRIASRPDPVGTAPRYRLHALPGDGSPCSMATHRRKAHTARPEPHAVSVATLCSTGKPTAQPGKRGQHSMHVPGVHPHRSASPACT
ncbi:hypothetical protein XAP412_390009 [Xanthomonas phaseoli pv. phaseoli]|uniref:Uncharacterized protein n=1 Tax=Xanthomonas campestris pv. phaseoli TaxID=317013 RepID=A0AB38E0H7_XANCH|nr:hypothetical protein XAP6984_440008 [Xanthomonas phaseoli pv. phaseoli]SON85120.1 hypothetical protein XAP412_390009 [Xanthomonas phaseoli pv. phaseoli]SON89615.1 hypothetical protein XAP7430_410008 [Xanthomonas phaseoli pv. phaseoli]SOO27874.1 hypothetical protein XAP6164_1930004 [Xanthomonas phaseoli pv. phaseoli]